LDDGPFTAKWTYRRLGTPALESLVNVGGSLNGTRPRFHARGRGPDQGRL